MMMETVFFIAGAMTGAMLTFVGLAAAHSAGEYDRQTGRGDQSETEEGA